MADYSDISSDSEMDNILSQALDIYEEFEDNKLFITQNTFRDAPEDDKENIYDILTSAVDVSDMLEDGGASEIGATRPIEPMQRFKAVSRDKVKKMSRPSVPPNTLKKAQWAVKLYSDWVAHLLSRRDDPEIVHILAKTFIF